MTIKKQQITEDYAIYNADCMDVIASMPDDSIDLSVYSPPFAGLYKYSSIPEDFSNCKSKEEFMVQYEYLIKEMSRITKPGRINVVHCTNVVNTSTNRMWGLPYEISKIYEQHGFHWVNQITIWKEPLKVRMRTMLKSLTHKTIIEDSTKAFTAMPDYLMIFKKTGESKIPVTHPFGLTHYAGATPMLPEMEKKYGTFDQLRKKYKGWKDQKTNKLSHIIWQRYASSVWDDIRIDEVLKFKDAREDDDEAHVHPLQLDVIDRCTELYSNPGETVLTPFMGVGSEVYGPVSMGRKAIGIELKESYFKQAVKNLKDIKYRFNKVQTLF